MLNLIRMIFTKREFSLHFINNSFDILLFRANRNFSHFAIIMSDRNVRVGCAASSYSEYAKKLGITLNTTLLACNYASTNMVEFPIYDTNCTAAAVRCNTGFNEKYLNLCSEREDFNINHWSKNGQLYQ